MANRISAAKLEELTESQQAEKLGMSGEDIKFMDLVSQSVKLIDGHHSIGLPWKNKDVIFPNNRSLAVQRAESLKWKYIRNQKFHQDYVKFMEEMLQKGYVEKL